jgi:predicted hotdog family 3-hydroxylacyl-ACP dehydratase
MTTLQDLVPHRPPLLLLDRVLEERENAVAAEAVVDPRAWCANPDGSLPAWFGIELMAQTVAAFSGVRQARKGQPARRGYLLGTRSMTCDLPAFPPGARLRVEAEPVFLDDSGISAFACRILLDGGEVARSVLTTCEVP